MKKFFFVVLLSIWSIFSFSQLKSGYEIEITIRGLKDSTVFLAYHLGDKQYIKDTIKLDNAGHGKVIGQEALPQGIYMIVLPGRKYFEMLISKDQRFSINCAYNDYFNTLKFTGSAENTAFVEYQNKLMKMQQQAGSIAKRIQNNKQNSDSVKILNSIQKLHS
jgi:hypothetical protein